jgi:hypothetical protein
VGLGVTRFSAPLLVLVALLCSACPPNGPGPAPVPQPEGVKSLAGGLATTSIAGVKHFEAMAYHEGGLLLPGRTLKFLIDRRNRAAPRVFFMNSNFTENGERPEAAKYHFHLAERVVDDFSESLSSFSKITYDTLDKRFIAGSIQTFYVDGATEPLYGIQFFPQDVARDDIVVETIRLVLPRLDLPGADIAFVATGEQQTVNGAAKKALADLGVAARTLDDVLGSIDYIPLNRGEAWGYLRLFPEDQDALAATDIAVFDELPLDLTVVAGTITRAYQDPTSHVNLKSKERGTPNMVLRSAGPDHAELAKWIDEPVHLTVAVDGFHIEASTDTEVRAKLAQRRSKPWVKLPFDPADEIRSYAQLCPADPADCLALTKQVGAKAAMLGFMTSPKVLGRVSDAGSLSARYGYDLVPAGVGLPFSLYRRFVDHPPNTELRTSLDALIADEMAGRLSPKQRAERSRAVRELFYTAAFPPGMLERIRKRITAVLPGVPKVKVRSSANAEDLPHFDGAGLYTSYAAKLTKKDDPSRPCKVKKKGVKLKMKPKTLSCGIRGVFASLWNKRAIDERSFARLDHRTALMGIAVVPDYDLDSPIAANSVVITRVVATENVYGYTLANQKRNVLVTNPTPGTLAENVVAAFNEPGEPASFAVTRRATPVAGQPPLKRTVYRDEEMRQLVEITRTAEIAYCRARPDYYGYDCRYAPADPRKARALDFELKYLENGHFICKQMREFSGR